MSIRGGVTLFKDIFTQEAPEAQRRGRSTTFDNERNECLITRYYFFGLKTGLRYELLVRIISRQFWISQRTVQNILFANHDILVRLRKENPTKTDLEKKWPHLNWGLPDLKDYI